MTFENFCDTIEKSLMKGLQNPRDLTILVELKSFCKKTRWMSLNGFHIPPRRREIIEEDCTIGEESKTWRNLQLRGLDCVEVKKVPPLPTIETTKRDVVEL